MATKTITIDIEAYERLASVRKANESFSEAIKRVVTRPLDPQAYLARLSANPLSAAAVRAIEDHIRARRAPSVRQR